MSDGDVVRRVTISASGQGIESTRDSVTSLGDAIAKTRDSASGDIFSATALAITGMGVAALSALAGMRAFIDFAGNQAKSLSDIAEHANVASISTSEFQQTMYAAMSSGVKENSFVTGFEAISMNIQKASQGVGEFKKLLEANGMSIQDKLTGELKTSKVVLEDIMKLIRAQPLPCNSALPLSLASLKIGFRSFAKA
jgi:hypothetical protein